ncbi:unnamed protein product [Absidia cylindrospora]
MYEAAEEWLLLSAGTTCLSEQLKRMIKERDGDEGQDKKLTVPQEPPLFFNYWVMKTRMYQTVWYQQSIEGHNLSWTEAKKLVVEKFTGASVQEDYMQLLMRMRPNGKERPVKFGDRFAQYMSLAEAEDSAIYGETLIKKLDRYYNGFGFSVRQTRAGIFGSKKPDLNAAFVISVWLVVYMCTPETFRWDMADQRTASMLLRHRALDMLQKGLRMRSSEAKERAVITITKSHDKSAGGSIRPNPRHHAGNRGQGATKDRSNDSDEIKRCRALALCFHCKEKWNPRPQV